MTTKSLNTGPSVSSIMKQLLLSLILLSTAYASASDFWVKQNIEHGSYILLNNGMLWAIDPFDKIDAMLWMSLDDIIIVESSKGSVGYNYLLINTSDKEQAHAKYMGKRNR
jgi:hypothetical protein